MVRVETAAPLLMAAVRVVVRPGQIASAWKPALDEVWAFLRSQQDLGVGHNLFLYHHPPDRETPMPIDFGVQVTRRFGRAGDVRCVEPPAGEIACARHVGPYSGIASAHNAIHAWAASAGRRIGAASWEIYGDWDEDPLKLETTICYLLA
jgi:effector-binding domain-containing protein